MRPKEPPCGDRPAPAREALALLPMVQDRILLRGAPLKLRLNAPAACSGVRFCALRQAGKACLKKLCLESAPIRRACVLKAEVELPALLEYEADGCPACLSLTLCLPVQGTLRTPTDRGVDFFPLVELRRPSLSFCGGCLELCLEYCVELLVLSPALFRLPCPPPEPDCRAFFDLPLYPAYRTPPA